MRHTDLEEVRTRLFHLHPSSLSTEIPHFQRPSLYHLFTFLFARNEDLHEFLVTIMSVYPSQRDWLSRFEECTQFCPNLYNVFMLLWCTSSLAFLSDLSPTELERTVKFLLSVMSSEEIGPYVREVIAGGIEQYRRHVTPELIRTIVLAIAQHIDDRHPGDHRSLRAFFQKERALCLSVAKEVIADGDLRLIRPFVQQIAAELHALPHSEEADRLVSTALDGLALLQPEGLKVPWVDCRRRAAAFVDCRGAVRVAISDGRRVARATAELGEPGKLPLDRVAFDPSGAMLLVHAAGDGTWHVLRVSRGDGRVELVLAMAWQAAHAAEWRGERSLAIGAATLDFP
jgi:hypothetical protein